MNPYRDTSPPPHSFPDLHDSSHNASLSANLSSPPVIQTGHSSVTVLSHNFPHYQASPDRDGGQNQGPSPYSDRSASPLTASDPGFIFRSRSILVPASSPTPNPYPDPATPPSCQVSVIIPSPDLGPSPLVSQCSEDSCPDLECSICFSQFNNVFRCPKMLQCKHTFCLECLARINVKSAEPNAIQCPLCRGLTPLPALGLPRLATNSDMLSYLPAAMQRVYSIRFLRNKGKLQVKRSSEGHRRWGQRSITSVNRRSLDVGLPSPPAGGRGEAGGVVGAMFRLTGRPGCRAFLLTSVVMMMVLLTGIIIYLLTFNTDDS
ncbi:RING finger protein 208 [Sebastes umbrosus]|uniref:RING finger protein 208 n=1 Tax=Sebastes umbrosus TaxID=72105 RepID=UPI00189CE0BF|nr:RING finger protein 208 [Sebastes umbrosus]XP_037633854.1 RING finger protein 208 [Sebastes umbrosus]XP_037633855.1 RING finger protein 208 [Sebastes umbrosus]XP_037633856.1 RING finger protein 208 [Sebastes umbrosus]